MNVFEKFVTKNPTPLQELAFQFVSEQTEYIDEADIVDWCQPRRNPTELLRLDGPTVKYFNDKLPGENELFALANEIATFTGAYHHSLGNTSREDKHLGEKMGY